MVSRQTTRPLRKLVPAVAIGVGALLGIVGCSAGQVAQTAGMEPAVNGNSGQAGQIALRDVQVAYPEDGTYEPGDDAPLLLTIVNSALTDDELVGVTTPAGQVELLGSAKIPGQSALQVVSPSENPAASTTTTTESSETSGSETSDTETSGTETSGTSETSGSETTKPTTTTTEESAEPPVVGTCSLVIAGLTGKLPFGKTVPVTFEFAKAGTVTIQLPVASPTTARAEPSEKGEEN